MPQLHKQHIHHSFTAKQNQATIPMLKLTLHTITKNTKNKLWQTHELVTYKVITKIKAIAFEQKEIVYFFHNF